MANINNFTSTTNYIGGKRLASFLADAIYLHLLFLFEVNVRTSAGVRSISHYESNLIFFYDIPSVD